MDIISIIRVLQRKLWILIAFPVVSIVCAAFFISKMDKMYKSTAQIATGFTSDEVVNLSEEKTSSQFEVTTKFINTIESMKSIPVVSLISYRMILHDLDSVVPFRKIKDTENLDFKLDKETIEKAKAIFKDRLARFETLNSFDPKDKLAFSILEAYKYDYETLGDQFSISRRSTSDFIIIEFLSENPLLSAYAVNTLCQEFLRFNKTLKTDRSSESIEFLENILIEKKRLRDEKTIALSEFKVANNVFNYSAESESKIMQISDYELNKELEEKKISGLALSLSTANAKIQSYKKVDKAEVTKINQRIIELRGKINEVSTSEGEAGKTKVNQLREELQLEISRLEMVNTTDNPTALIELTRERDRLELELQIANSNLSAINQSLRKLKYDVSGFATKEAKIADLQRDLQVASDDYQSAQEKFNAASNKASVIGSSMRQILHGQPSNEPEPSKGILLAGLAGIGSFVLCALIIVSIELSNFSIRTQSRLESLTGLRNVAVLNLVNVQILDLPKIFEGKNKDNNLEVFVHLLRKLRFEIQNSKDDVLLVTSTKPNVGKSFMIVCLSYTLSLLNKNILIIDTNFKNNTLTKLLIQNLDEQKLIEKGISPETSSARLLTGSESKGDPKETVSATPAASNNKSIIYKTKFKGVDIIGNFGGKDSPSEILAGKDFKDMLKNFSLQYDYIILEGPSLNEYSDTKELVEYAGKVIPVFDAETVLNNLDHDSVKYLKTIKSKVIGSVLNKVNLKDLSI